MRVTAETRNATRQRILDAAQAQFVRQGFEATTTRDLASAAQIAAGTLFNYFPTKEAIALCLVNEACERGAVAFAAADRDGLSLEEELFAHVAAHLRKLKPYRAYLPAVLETALSPLAADSSDERPPVRIAHLEVVSQIAAHHGGHEVLSPVALNLYWTLFTGVLAFWAKDASPRQEDTLALLDESLAMFAGWLSSTAVPPKSKRKEG